MRQKTSPCDEVSEKKTCGNMSDTHEWNETKIKKTGLQENMGIIGRIGDN